MEINPQRIFDAMVEQVNGEAPVTEAMHAIIDVCDGDLPHGDWQQLKGLDYEAGADEVGAWAFEAIKRQPPSRQIEGLWFGLVTLGNQDRTSTYTDVHLAGTSSYDADDDMWVFSIDYFPDDPKYARSAVLRDIIKIAWGTLDANTWSGAKAGGALGMNAEWALTLAFTAVALRRRLAPSLLDLLRSPQRLGVIAGFDCGDMIKVGELTPSGWSAPARATR